MTSAASQAKTPAKPRRVDVDSDWADLAAQFSIRPGTIYLNHGSFGISPDRVRAERRRWLEAVDGQPMDIFVRQAPAEINKTRETLARFVGTQRESLVLVDNATFGMNVVAFNWKLKPGDQIVLNPHEYGAVRRIWNRAVAGTGAEVVDLKMPERFESPDELTDQIMRQLSPRATMLVISHITSPTALIFPVAQICAAARERGIAVCIDGPHAPAHVPIDIDALGCDFYTASCHKWLAATLGSGFLYVHPRWHSSFRPLVQSWGLLLPEIPETWDEEFTWSGTQDPSVYLSIPAAIDFHLDVGPEVFRSRCYWLAEYVSQQLSELFKTEPLGGGSHRWYGTMAHVPLPPGDWSKLQEKLWAECSIEVPIVHFADRWFVRVSCHLYTTQQQLDFLVTNLARLTAR